MDCELDARGRCGFGQRLCGATDNVRACVPRSAGLCGPATLSSTGQPIRPHHLPLRPPPLPGRQGSQPRQQPTGRLQRAAPAPCRHKAATQPASPAATAGCRGSLGPAAASGRGHSGRSGALLCLDAGLLVLERRLDMDRRPMGGSATARRRLGGRPLGQTGPRLCLDRRRLAVAEPPVSSSRSSACISCRCRKGRGRCGRPWGRRGRAWPSPPRRRLR